MKNKRIYAFSFVTAILLVSIFAPTAFVKADLQVSELPLTDVILSVGGTPIVAAGGNSFQSVPFSKNIGLELNLNGTINEEGMSLNSFAENDLASELFQTDGIARTFSDSYTSRISGLSTGTGLFQTLRTIPESSFSQYTILKDSTVYSFSLPEPIAKLVNDTVNDAYPTLTYLNVTINELYLTYVFDRSIIDNFFATAKESGMYESVSEDYSTNKQLITSMMDPIFTSTGFHDIVYAPVNVSTYPGDWSLIKENRAVLGLNASDTSFDNATKTASLRDLMIGYLGWKIVDETIVNAQGQLEAVDKKDLPGDIIYGFEQTATTYSLKMDILTDFTGSGLVWNYSLIIDVFGLADEVGPRLVSTYAWFLVIGCGVGVFFAAILTGVVLKKQNLKLWAIFGFLAGIITSVIVFIATTVTVVT